MEKEEFLVKVEEEVYGPIPLNRIINDVKNGELTKEATFFDYAGFINTNPNFPRIERLRYLAEHKINLKNITPSRLIKWFGDKKPYSGYGKLMLGESLIKINQVSPNLKHLFSIRI